MEQIIVIQDVKTKEYFAGWSDGPFFDANLRNAQEYSSTEAAEKELKDENEQLGDLFTGRFIEIKEYYKFEE